MEDGPPRPKIMIRAADGVAATFDVDRAVGDLEYGCEQKRYWAADVYFCSAASIVLRGVVFWAALVSGAPWLALASLGFVVVDLATAAAAYWIGEWPLRLAEWTQILVALAKIAYLVLWCVLYRSVATWAFVTVVACLALHLGLAIRTVMGLANIVAAMYAYEVICDKLERVEETIRKRRAAEASQPAASKKPPTVRRRREVVVEPLKKRQEEAKAAASAAPTPPPTDVREVVARLVPSSDGSSPPPATAATSAPLVVRRAHPKGG